MKRKMTLSYKISLIGLLLLNLVGIPWILFAMPEAILEIGKFSAAQPGGDFPNGWQPLIFEKIKKHTLYTIVETGKEGVVVKATSNQSSSGLAREIKIDPKEYPIIQWRWKIENILKNSNISSKDGDDYPARIYVTFEYDSSSVGFFEKAAFELRKFAYGQYPPIGAINYIWDSKAPIGTVAPNPYTDRVSMIVLQSGDGKINQWVTEEHNIFKDYKKSFGKNPTKISGVAIMTDTDNTKESAVSYYGNIVFKKAKALGRS